MAAPLVKNPAEIRLASIGMVEGNGHPYSWSAIINGFNREAMAGCPYTAIPEYLFAQPDGEIGIAGVRVTHLWCENGEEAMRVAEASLIPNILNQPEEAIGKVDAVLIPTDIGSEHLDRARPFVEAGIPVFIDKPLTDREDHLAQFIDWWKQGKAILSSSCMRYAQEFVSLRQELPRVGQPLFGTMTTPKSWERYGIHALEGAYPLFSSGDWKDVVNTGTEEANIVHIRHNTGFNLVIAAIREMKGCFGLFRIYGTEGVLAADFGDTFSAFKRQLVSFVDYLRTGTPPFPYTETVELMKIIIAGIRSRERAGTRIDLHLIGETHPDD